MVAWLCVIFPLWIYLLALFCYHCDFVLSFAQDLSRYYILSFWYYILSRRCSKLCSGLCCEIIFCLLDIYIISTSALHHIRQSRFYCFTCNKNRTSVWHSLGCVTWILYFIEALFEALLWTLSRNYILYILSRRCSKLCSELCCGIIFCPNTFGGNG